MPKVNPLFDPALKVWVIEIDFLDGLNWFVGVTYNDTKAGRLHSEVWTTEYNDLIEGAGMFDKKLCESLLQTVLSKISGCKIRNYFERREFLETYKRPAGKIKDISEFKPD